MTTENWTRWLTDGERLALKVYRRGPHRAGEAGLESFARSLAASRALVAERRSVGHALILPFDDNGMRECPWCEVKEDYDPHEEGCAWLRLVQTLALTEEDMLKRLEAN